MGCHLCAVAQRVFDGGERWEFDEGEDGSTRVTLHSQFTAERQS
jgi:hypothetical protein